MNKRKLTLLILSGFLSISSCTFKQQHTGSDIVPIVFDKIPLVQITELSDTIFDSIYYIPIETSDSVLLGDNLQMKLFLDDYYVWDKVAQQQIFRFNKNGEFQNTIGERGKGPMEYVALKDFTFDFKKEQIYLLVGLNNKQIYCYDLLGNWLKSIDTKIPANSIVRQDSCFILNIGYKNYFSKDRLYQLDDNGKCLHQFHAITTKLLDMDESNFYQRDSCVYFHEAFCNSVCEVRKNNVTPVYSIDFGNNNIPDDVHEMEPMKVLEFLNSRGMNNINAFCTNDHFAYFFISHQSEEEYITYHLIINKVNQHALLMQFPPEYNRMAEDITKNDELVFLISPSDYLSLIKRSSFFSGNLNEESIDEEQNPLIAKFKIKSF